MLLTTTPAHVVHLFDDARVYIAIVLSSRFTTDIGRGADQRLLESVAQLFREGFLRDAQGYASILSNQVWGQVHGTIENQRCGFYARRRTVGNCGGFQAINELPGDIGHIAHIALQTGIAIDETNHRLRVVTLLDVVHALHGLCICGITAYTPYSICRIEYHPTLLQHLYGISYIFFSCHNYTFCNIITKRAPSV